MSILYVCLVLAVSISSVASQEPDPESQTTNYTTDLANIRNGIYDNDAQSRQNTSTSFLQLRSQPLRLSFTTRPAWFTEVARNSIVFRAEVEILAQTGNATSIRLVRYNIAAAIGSRFNTFNASTLSNFTQADLGPQNPECFGEAVRSAKAVYVINRADCRNQTQGNYSNFVETVTCRSITLVFPSTDSFLSNRKPYLLFRKGVRYPLPNNIPDNFDALC